MYTFFMVIYETVAHTPWWVFVLLGYLIFIGIKSSKDSTVSIYKLAILPVVFFFLSIETLVTHFDINLLSLGTWSLSMAGGILIGVLLVIRQKILVDREHKLLRLPGSWTTLILVLTIFVGKYYCGYALSQDSGATINTSTEILVLAISGLCSGSFVGRMLPYLYRLYKQPSVDLSKRS